MFNAEAFDRIARRIESFRNEMIDMQVRLTALPAIAPASGGEGEGKRAEFLSRFLEANGFVDIQLLQAPDLDAPEGSRPNLLARYKGKSSARTVWIMTHMDIVPPGEMSLWKGDPYKAWIEKGRVYGRGVEDNQQDLVSSLFAVKAFQAEGLLPVCDVGIALVADEETGSKKGIDYVLEHTNAFRKQDLIIVPDAGNESGTLIEVAEKSILWLKVKTMGKQAHGSTPEKGINSFKAASYLITELDALYRTFDRTDPLFDPPISTFEPTKKEANVPNVNTIPGEDIFHVDARILPGYDVDAVIRKVREIADGIERAHNVKITITEEQNAPAAPPTPATAGVVTALKTAIREVYQKDAKASGIGGGTVAALFRRRGFEAACWSRIDETAHMPNEYSVIDNMVGDAKVYAHILLQE